MLSCPCVISTVATLIDKVWGPTLGSFIHLYVPHAVSALLTSPQDITSSQETTSQGAKSSKVQKIQVSALLQGHKIQ